MESKWPAKRKGYPKPRGYYKGDTLDIRDITFAKGTAYRLNIRHCLNRDEEEGLHLTLANNPFRGEPIPESEEILEFGPFCQHYVYYIIGRNKNEIILLDIGKTKVPRFSPDEKSELKKWMEVVREEVVRKAIKIILELMGL